MVRYDRVIWPAVPDTTAEFEGAVYATGVIERIDTRLHRLTPVDGVVVL